MTADDDARREGGDDQGTGKGEVVARCSPNMTGKQRRYLRSLAHHLKPVVQIGEKGVHEGVVAQLDQALLDHELVKVKYRGAAPEDRAEAAETFYREVGGQTVQILGNTLVVYRPHPEEPTICLPRGREER